MKAPEFPENLPWLNTDHPLTLEELKGKIVLLDFWTYCCINCMHVLPELARLEEKYPELVVIGVHSAKFRNEKEQGTIKQAVLRYGIKHPMIVDSDFLTWNSFGIRAWPSFVLIDPEGEVVERSSGEGAFEKFDSLIRKISKQFSHQGILDSEPREFIPEELRTPATGLLRFPGKLSIDEAGRRLFISDSGHNRLIITNPEGEVLDVAGSGEEGADDGSFEEARFNSPQGTAFHLEENCLYLADTVDHVIRKLDLKGRTVTTILGTGKQASSKQREAKGTRHPLNSPWDLEIGGEYLYIAMAGSHQLWRMKLGSGVAEVCAGSGREGIEDGDPLLASLAQPSGLSTNGEAVYFTDSETSAIRKFETERVSTLVGTGLFDFGDVDGFYPDSRLQHAIGLCWQEGQIYVADSYNHKIKVLDPSTTELKTLAGTGEAGLLNGNFSDVQFSEPSDIAFLEGKMYIADTNNHRIRVLDQETNVVSNFNFTELGPLASSIAQEIPAKQEPVRLPEKRVSPQTLGLHLLLGLAHGLSLTEGAPHVFRVISGDANVVEIIDQDPELSFPEDFIPCIFREGKTELRILITAYYCRKGESASCLMEDVELVLPVVVEDSGVEELRVNVGLGS